MTYYEPIAWSGTSSSISLVIISGDRFHLPDFLKKSLTVLPAIWRRKIRYLLFHKDVSQDDSSLLPSLAFPKLSWVHVVTMHHVMLELYFSSSLGL